MRGVHGRDSRQPRRAAKSSAREGIRINKGPQEQLITCSRWTGARREDGGHTGILIFRKADPQVDAKRFGKNPAPIGGERFSSREAAQDFIQHKTKDPGSVGWARFDRQKGRLFFDRPHDALAIENIRGGILERAQPRAMREDLAKRERALSSLREFRPEIRNACVKIHPRFLHRMERAGGSHALGGGPDQNERLIVPWHRASRVAKTSAKRDDFLAAAKDAQSGTDLDTVGEVFFKCLPHPAHI